MVCYITILTATSCPVNVRTFRNENNFFPSVSSSQVEFLLTYSHTSYHISFCNEFTSNSHLILYDISPRIPGRASEQTITLQRHVTRIQIFRYQSGIPITFKASGLDAQAYSVESANRLTNQKAFKTIRLFICPPLNSGASLKEMLLTNHLHFKVLLTF